MAELEARLLIRNEENKGLAENAAEGDQAEQDEKFGIQAFMERQKEIISKMKQENSKRQEEAIAQMRSELCELETKHAAEIANIELTNQKQEKIQIEKETQLKRSMNLVVSLQNHVRELLLLKLTNFET